MGAQRDHKGLRANRPHIQHSFLPALRCPVGERIYPRSDCIPYNTFPIAQYSTISSSPLLLPPASFQLHQMTSLKEKMLSPLTPAPLCTSTTITFAWGLIHHRWCHLLGNQTLLVHSAALHITPP